MSNLKVHFLKGEKDDYTWAPCGKIYNKNYKKTQHLKFTKVVTGVTCKTCLRVLECGKKMKQERDAVTIHYSSRNIKSPLDCDNSYCGGVILFWSGNNWTENKRAVTCENCIRIMKARGIYEEEPEYKIHFRTKGMKGVTLCNRKMWNLEDIENRTTFVSTKVTCKTCKEILEEKRLVRKLHGPQITFHETQLVCFMTKIPGVNMFYVLCGEMKAHHATTNKRDVTCPNCKSHGLFKN